MMLIASGLVGASVSERSQAGNDASDRHVAAAFVSDGFLL